MENHLEVGRAVINHQTMWALNAQPSIHLIQPIVSQTWLGKLHTVTINIGNLQPVRNLVFVASKRTRCLPPLIAFQNKSAITQTAQRSIDRTIHRFFCVRVNKSKTTHGCVREKEKTKMREILIEWSESIFIETIFHFCKFFARTLLKRKVQRRKIQQNSNNNSNKNETCPQLSNV